MNWFLKKKSKKFFLYEKICLLILYNMVWFIFRCDHYFIFYLLYLIFLYNLIENLVRESPLWSSLALSSAGAGLTM